MMQRRNAVLLFAKPPVAGLVKTRLTPIKDGILSPEAAAGLYHCMLFDVVEACCDALSDLEGESTASDFDVQDVYDLFISTTPLENLQVMREIFEASGTWPRDIRFICDTGASFDEHYNDSFQQVWDDGYDTILSMGADMPALPRSVVVEGFHRLHDLCDIPGGGLVLSPDQEMGVSIVGWTRSTDMTHDGVFYNPDGLTVLPAYIQKAQQRNLPVLYLPAVPDVDTMADLRHNITLVQAMMYCAQFQKDLTAPWRTADALVQMGLSEVRVMPNDLHDSREGIDKPGDFED